MVSGPNRLTRRQAGCLCLTALLGLSACATATPADDPAPLLMHSSADLLPFRVARPGIVLIDGKVRRGELLVLPAALRTTLCGERDSFSVRPAVSELGVDADRGPDERSQRFALTVMEATAAYLAAPDQAAPRDALLGNLDRWAKDKALLDFDRRQENAYYALDRTLLPTIVAWSLVNDDPAVKSRQHRRIAAWLKRVVRARGDLRPPHRPLDVSARNNHAYLAASVDMAWGSLTGNDDYFRSGPMAYRMAIGDMRADGSLPLETARGARALWYQRHAIASLTTIAEMAAAQGYDLYGYARNGRSLDAAIRFLLDAIDDPALVEPYAAENYKPGPQPEGPGQDLGFLQRRGRVRHYMAWAEYYIARFPDRDTSRRLRRLLESGGARFRPMVDDYSGGNTTCFVTDPATV